MLTAYRQVEELLQEDFDGAAHRTYINELERGLKIPTLESSFKTC
ncbi:MAG: hypothetical protein O4861_19465 [Trichodesmium sp. St16_bin4-tuft]|nr:hypothetical protein [Trichodesmium sp. St16_bin4-tuft]